MPNGDCGTLESDKLDFWLASQLCVCHRICPSDRCTCNKRHNYKHVQTVRIWFFFSTNGLDTRLYAMQVDLPQFKVGDLVKVSSDMEKVRGLQQGHGDWSNAVLLVGGLHMHA